MHAWNARPVCLRANTFVPSHDWHASYAKASEERPNERYIDFQLKKQKFDMDLSDERQPFDQLQNRLYHDIER